MFSLILIIMPRQSHIKDSDITYRKMESYSKKQQGRFYQSKSSIDSFPCSNDFNPKKSMIPRICHFSTRTFFYPQFFFLYQRGRVQTLNIRQRVIVVRTFLIIFWCFFCNTVCLDRTCFFYMNRLSLSTFYFSLQH